jgi:archaellum biogenesis ATPase FlaH
MVDLVMYMILYDKKQDIEPYVGPRPFGLTMEAQMRFFGRDEEAQEILTLILTHKLVLIYAQSGAGKTSLFNARVIPYLENEEYQVLPVARIGARLSISFDQFHSNIKPTSQGSINTYVLNALQSIAVKVDSSVIFHMSLTTYLNEFFPVQKDKRGNVLIFDQLEEIFNFTQTIIG